ncbi:histone chaperone like [Capsicum annuum]|uniref:histone chaperone RTT106-like n=1 Tax=Capsicum annuum TaxID=4072 RepID=UPI001FB055BF|nr:histone chaperone RTT106-like [Capsicum annuum]
MKKFKAFTDEPKDIFIDGLKAHLEGVTAITSSEDGEDGDDDRDLGGKTISRHVTRGTGMSKPRASRKTSMIENLEKRVFRLEESIKDIVDFVKEKRLRRAEKEKCAGAKSAFSGKGVCDDNGIKKALLEVAALEQASINADEVMIPEVAAVVEKENLDEEKNKADGSTGMEKEDDDERRQDEDDKSEKSGCEEENNEGNEEKVEEKNAEEVEKEEGEEHKKKEKIMHQKKRHRGERKRK